MAIGFDEFDGVGREIVFTFAAFGFGRFGYGLAGMIKVETLVGGQKAFVAQMPLANASGCIAGFAQIFGKRLLFKWEMLIDDRVQQLLRCAIRPARQVSREMQA